MDYTVIYSERRTLAVQIKPRGQVIVRAPRFVTKRTIERFLTEKEPWIKAKLSEQRVRKIDRDLSSQEIAALKEQAKTDLIYRLDELSRQTGLTYRSASIGTARTRFGSCTANDDIRLSSFLMLYPPLARDYVIVHELCHTCHKDHSKAFHALLSSLFPKEREAKAMLSQ